MEKILLLDGPAIAYRSHFGLAKAALTTPDGRDVAATYGYAVTVLKLLREESPDYACVAFDTEEPTYRHELFEQYKANRPDMPDELAYQLGWIEKMSEGLGMRVLAVHGFEADDVIATLTAEAETRGIEVVIVTGDKDMLQLVDDTTRVIVLSGFGRDTQIMDERAVRAKYGIPPRLLTDYFGLMGDAVDNVPGVRGIGPKTAGKLVKEYGSLESIYEALENISMGGVRKILAENREAAFASRELVPVKWEPWAEWPKRWHSRREQEELNWKVKPDSECLGRHNSYTEWEWILSNINQELNLILEEERRVFHVAVTRAKDELYLVVPQLYRNRSRSLVMMKPSRFLSEIDQHLTEEMELEESLPHLIAGDKPDVSSDSEQT